MSTTFIRTCLVGVGIITSIYLIFPSAASFTPRSYYDSRTASSRMFTATKYVPTVQVRFTAPETIPVDGPGKITVTLTHDWSDDLNLLNWNSPLGTHKAQGAYTVTDSETGESAEFGLVAVKRAIPATIPSTQSGQELDSIQNAYLNAFITIPSGPSGLSKEVDILQGPQGHIPFKLEPGRKYKIESSGLFHDWYSNELDRSRERHVPFYLEHSSYTEQAKWECVQSAEFTAV